MSFSEEEFIRTWLVQIQDEKPPDGKYIAVLNPKFYTMLRYSTTGSRICKARRMARRA